MWNNKKVRREEKKNRLNKIVPLNKSTDTVRRVRLTLRGRVDSAGGGGMLAADESRRAGWDV